MARLQQGQTAPDFTMLNLNGESRSIEYFRGKYILLSFYRYASCPFCNLRISQIMQRADDYKTSGLEIVSVFQSPHGKIQQYVGKQNPPFDIIPDPDRKLYKIYKVETAWLGLLSAMVFKMGDMLKAFASGFLPGSMEGEINRLPADFLIGPEGEIIEAYYGKDIGDHMPFDMIEQAMSQPEAVTEPV